MNARVSYEYIIEGFPTIAEGNFHYGSPSLQLREKFYFRGLADGRWFLELNDEQVDHGTWESGGFGMDADIAKEILTGCLKKWGTKHGG
jgi:hypothetical protein